MFKVCESDALQYFMQLKKFLKSGKIITKILNYTIPQSYMSLVLIHYLCVCGPSYTGMIILPFFTTNQPIILVLTVGLGCGHYSK